MEKLFGCLMRKNKNPQQDSFDQNTLSMKNVSYGGQQFSLTIKTNEQDTAQINPISTARSRTSKDIPIMNSSRDIKNNTSTGIKQKIKIRDENKEVIEKQQAEQKKH